MNNSIQRSLLVLALAVAVPNLARAYFGGVDNLFTVIPDGDLNGIRSSQTFTGIPGAVTHVSVTLNTSGGINGDLYGYLMHNGKRAVLLNRVGRSGTSGVGYADAGFGPDASLTSFLFDDEAGYDVHLYRTFGYQLNESGQLTGAWQPDGRGLDPLSERSAFDMAPRSSLLSAFDGTDPNGLWTLYLSDVSSLEEGTLVSWGLVVDVPEPNCAMLMLLGLAVVPLCSAARRHVR